MSSCSNKATAWEQLQDPKAGDPIAVIKTSMGDITIRLFPEAAPKAVENFTTHAKNGYYDGVIFHRVIEDFMLQTGDPTGTGRGGESIWGGRFEDETSVGYHHIRGAVSMANAGPGTNGSQFFIVHSGGLGAVQTSDGRIIDLEDEFKKAIADAKYPFFLDWQGWATPYNLRDRIPVEFIRHYVEHGGTPHLDWPGIGRGSRHSVFGQVADGWDVIDAIAAVAKDRNDRPLEDVSILSVEITEFK
ncbi:MAG: peptidylprolyl isomerase [Defluviitaleaceae bacterium]|nr:peptidylprolyl isomerase [Defluviitaleaceae bacterium]MCL2835994.1 peptidylprolyl isomerase [Defluviitaleaceae bacterium]